VRDGDALECAQALAREQAGPRVIDRGRGDPEGHAQRPARNHPADDEQRDADRDRAAEPGDRPQRRAAAARAASTYSARWSARTAA
jgi:hypothetical protein